MQRIATESSMAAPEAVHIALRSCDARCRVDGLKHTGKGHRQEKAETTTLAEAGDLQSLTSYPVTKARGRRRRRWSGSTSSTRLLFGS